MALSGRLSADFTLEVAFAVPAAGVTALLGASGSGKTSVLRALAGLDRHTGSVGFGDEVWQDDKRFVPTHRRGLGYVAQGVGLLPHLTVAGNLDYATRRAGSSDHGARRGGGGGAARDDVVARTGIAGLLDRLPAKLSGGEAQRASIARALVGRPRLLLMDEPLSGLDAVARGDLVGELATLFAGLAIPVVYVTHDAAEAERLAARTIRLRAGRVE